MYVVSNLSSNAIEGTRKEGSVGDVLVTNGKFFLPTPPGVAVEVNSSSFLFPQTNPLSLPYQIANGFLERNPNYDHVVSNFFLEANDLAMLDTTATPPYPTGANVASGYLPVRTRGSLGARFQIGRASLPPVGIVPNAVAVLPANTKVTGTDNYGSIITDTVNLIPYNPAGTDEVYLWWKIAKYQTSEDIVQGYGATLGQNTPAQKELTEIDPDYSDFYVYASVDDGVTWYQAEYLTPTDLVVAGTNLRLAFINEGTDKIYLLGFAVLFPNP